MAYPVGVVETLSSEAAVRLLNGAENREGAPESSCTYSALGNVTTHQTRSDIGVVRTADYTPLPAS